MKKVLIGLLTLGSISAFSSTYSCRGLMHLQAGSENQIIEDAKIIYSVDEDKRFIVLVQNGVEQKSEITDNGTLDQYGVNFVIDENQNLSGTIVLSQMTPKISSLKIKTTAIIQKQEVANLDGVFSCLKL